MKKAITILILVIMLTMTVGAGLLYPRPAKAFGASDIFAPLNFAANLATKIYHYTQPAIQKALKTAGDVAYKNSLRYFLSKVAYDTATYIATGGAGQKPLFVTNWKKYFQQTADEAAGVFFEKLSKGGKGHCESNPKQLCSSDSQCGVIDYTLKVVDGKLKTVPVHDKCIGVWGGLGIDLCEPLEPMAKVRLTVAAKRSLEPRKPRCTGTQIRKNLKDIRKLKLDQLVDFSSYFEPGANELGAYLSIRTSADEAIKRNTQRKNLQSIIEGGFRSVTNPITGAIKTPAKTVADTLNLSMNKAFVPQETYTGSPVADAVGVFTNTLVSKLLQRVFKKGFNPQAERGVVSDFWTLGGVQAARLFFGELAEVNYQFNVGMQLDDFVIKGNGQFNQVINDSFRQAIEQKCTVGQAIGYYQPGDDAYRAECNNLISGRATFGFDQDGTEPDINNGIPYRSILVLRKFRIVPVGWELAAQYYKKFDKRKEKLNLNFLVSRYNLKKIDDDNNPNTPEVPNPYYGLVDPNWLLKFPITRCVKQGAGPQKIVQEPYCNGQMVNGECKGEMIYPFQRLDYCADYETCLDDTSGRCDANDWGYCVEEKPVWNIKGTKCKKKYYATCQNLVNQGSQQQVSYLLNTLSDYNDGVCNNANAGCREYCEDFNPAAGKWACTPASGRKEYLNSQAKACGPTSEGCHLFYSSATRDKAEIETAFKSRKTDPHAYGLLNENYVKLAPDYYHCQGYTRPIAGINQKKDCQAPHFWRSDLHRCVESGSDECANFVKHCQPSDVNCSLYTPISTQAPAVPAVIEPKVCPSADPFCKDETNPAIAWNDECPASCVGYQTYHQVDTAFEPGDDFSFIASTAKVCSQPGCDQFTNLDKVAQGGEGIEYYSYLRQCIKPAEGGWSTYYTWEGSDTSGYQLKKWELKTGGDGGPYYLEGGAGPDNKGCRLNDKDCREFFDANLKSYRRYFSKTISVSDDCHPFRRTEDQKIYNAIPSQGIVCSAEDAGCREYKSNRGYNYQKIIESYFTQANDLNGWSGGNVSSESVRRGDYSLHINGVTQHNLDPGDLEEGKIYTLEFLAKGSGKLTAGFTGGQTVSNAINLESAGNWLHYTLKLPSGLQGLNANQISNNKLEINAANAYLDNIVLKKMESILLIKNSWKTPKECDTSSNLSGGTAKESMLNCEAYQDGHKNKLNLRSFKNLCFEDVAGCQLVIDSKNSQETADDEKDYLVLDKKYKCEKEAKGCAKLGLITPDRNDGSKYAFEDKYKIIDPDNSQQFCQANEVFCQAYQDAKNNFYYFKDPLNRTCEFKKVNDVYNWYQTGTEKLCKDSASSPNYAKHCLGGRSADKNNLCQSDTDCTNLAEPGKPGICTDWVGLCEAESSGCREYQDPQSPKGCDKSILNYGSRHCQNDANKPCQTDTDCGANGICVDQCDYYYYKDVEKCAQGVNPAQGCVGFKQTDNPKTDIRSYKVCENNTSQACDQDSDCGTGKCVYTNAP